MPKSLFFLFASALFTLSACDRIEERQDRFATLSKAVASQLTGEWTDNRSDPGFARPMAERAIAAKTVNAEDRARKQHDRRLLLNSLILTPALSLPDPVTSEPEDPDKAVKKPGETSRLAGLAAFGFDIRTDDIAGGFVRLTFDLPQRQADGERKSDPWLDQITTHEGEIPACGDVGLTGLSATTSPLLRLACLKDWLMTTGHYETISYDSLLALQQTNHGFASTDPLSAFRWSYTPYTAPLPANGPGPIAVLDTGLHVGHPDLAPFDASIAFDVISSADAAGDGTGMDRTPVDAGDLCDPTNVFQSDSWHGTAMAGLIGQARTENQIGISSMIARAPIANIRVAGRCGARLSDLINGLAWAGGLSALTTDEGEEVRTGQPASVMVLPLASHGVCPPQLQSVLDDLDEKGILVVAAAGNNGSLASDVYPANCRHVLAVAASGPDHALTGYSNYGLAVDIMAPGGDVSQDLNADGWPDGILVPGPSEDCRDPLTEAETETCSYALLEGTSLAAAHVASALFQALLHNPEGRPGAVLQTFLSTRDEISPLACKGPCPETSDGVPIDTHPGQCYRRCGIGQL